MKNLKLISVIFFLFSTSTLWSQSHKKQDTIVFKTSGDCYSHKTRIEGELASEKGIKSVAYELKTAKVKVVYNPKEITSEKIKQIINKLGLTASVYVEPPVVIVPPDTTKKAHRCCSAPHHHHVTQTDSCANIQPLKTE